MRVPGWCATLCYMMNVEVARRVLGPEAALRPVFVWVPLQIRSPHGMVAVSVF